MDRLGKVQIIVAAIAALVLLVVRSGMLEKSDSLSGPLEAVSFVLSAVAILNSGKGLREQYQHLGFDKRAARQSTEYMETRQSVRWWSYVATLIIVALAAARFNVPVALAVGAVAVALPILILVADRASGWRGPAET